MSNQELIRKAYLWNTIIRMGFSPSGEKEINKWLHMYGKSLYEFWQPEEYPEHPVNKNGAIITTIDSPLGMTYEYFIKYTGKQFSVRLMYHIPNSTSTNGLLWTHEYDDTYFSFPSKDILSKLNRERDAMQSVKEEDISEVLTGMIFHPAVHQHIEFPSAYHEIRLDSSTSNPYLYLFGLRYQLCPDDKGRKNEKERLCTLFRKKFRSPESKITNSELFDLSQS